MLNLLSRFVVLIFTMSLICTSVSAAEKASGKPAKPKWEFGLQVGAGVALAPTGDKDSTDSSTGTLDVNPDIASPAWNDPSFAFSSNASVGFYILPTLAFELELGIISRGYRKDLSSQPDEELDSILRIWYLSLPLGVKLNFHNFRIGIAFALDIGIVGRYRIFGDNGFNDRRGRVNDAWASIERVNFGPHVSFGYGIPAGSLILIPGVTWSMHLRDDMPSYPTNVSVRYMNIMANVGVSFSTNFQR